MKTLIFLIILSIFDLNSIEISLEENKAESGTVGYVDIVNIFKIYSLNPKKDFEIKILEKQQKVDELKKELDFLKSTLEKLKTEYQIAKMYEDFYKNISSQISYSGDISTSTVDESTQTISTSTEISTHSSVSESSNISSNTVVSQEPYIIMPGIGKMPIRNFKFSVSSSTIVIEDSIKELDSKIKRKEEEIIDMKEKFDKELSKQASKENEKILKKIYDAISEVAEEEGVSIIVDKKNILFGRKTVDLTDKVLQKLGER